MRGLSLQHNDIVKTNDTRECTYKTTVSVVVGRKHKNIEKYQTNSHIHTHTHRQKTVESPVQCYFNGKECNSTDINTEPHDTPHRGYAATTWPLLILSARLKLLTTHKRRRLWIKSLSNVKLYDSRDDATQIHHLWPSTTPVDLTKFFRLPSNRTLSLLITSAVRQTTATITRNGTHTTSRKWLTTTQKRLITSSFHAPFRHIPKRYSTNLNDKCADSCHSLRTMRMVL